MIILFGSNGYIGNEFKKQLTLNYKVLCWQNTRSTTLQSLNDWYFNNKEKIELVINAAGYTGKPNVDSCELHKAETIDGNILWPTKLSYWCKLHNLPLGHVSSGCIYQGKNGEKPFTELDKPNFTFKQNNCSFYSGTKAIAEDVVSEWENSYIWRLRIPFESNDNSRNFISKMLRYEKILISENSISHKEEFVNACISLFQNKCSYGIYNIVNNGVLTTSNLIKKLQNTIAKNKQFNLINEDEFYKTITKIPRSNCVLDNSKLLSCGIKMRHVEEAIDYCLENWNSIKCY